mmetsp:Transcript_56448/g.150996  ORF Transcript_56448/g.150996 Transcript_56448/m.150996 type:complete len:320 (+) Transcript_56448:438-1397(+)
MIYRRMVSRACRDAFAALLFSGEVVFLAEPILHWSTQWVQVRNEVHRSCAITDQGPHARWKERDLMLRVIGVCENDPAYSACIRSSWRVQQVHQGTATSTVRHNVDRRSGALGHEVLPNVPHMSIGRLRSTDLLPVLVHVLIRVHEDHTISGRQGSCHIRHRRAPLQILIDAQRATPDTNTNMSTPLNHEQQSRRLHEPGADENRNALTSFHSERHEETPETRLFFQHERHVTIHCFDQAIVVLLPAKLKAFVAPHLIELMSSILVAHFPQISHGVNAHLPHLGHHGGHLLEFQKVSMTGRIGTVFRRSGRGHAGATSK